jgi:hypothetical protein
MTTTTMMQTSNGRPGRVFLANFISGPLAVAALVTFPITAFTVTVASMDHRLPWGDVFRLTGTWPMNTMFFFLSSIIAGLAAALYATIETRVRGTYSVPMAILIAIAVAFVVTGGTVSNVAGLINALLFAALGAAAAGWLARRSGATWRFA